MLKNSKSDGLEFSAKTVNFIEVRLDWPLRSISEFHTAGDCFWLPPRPKIATAPVRPGNFPGLGENGVFQRNLQDDRPGSEEPRTRIADRCCSLMSQWLWLGFERQVTFGCLRSLRAPGHLMGSAGCGAAWLKPQSAKSAGRVRQNRRRHPLPPSGVAPAREFVSVSFLPGARVRRT